MAYIVEFARSVKEHLRFLSADQRSRVILGIEEHLIHEPIRETRNRKPLRPNPIAPWELRLGELRVFYDVALGEGHVVQVLAVDWKERDKLFIGGKEFRL
jgi:mRNA-degrading endonuclease RelE of RelBE toxin-antitoxin system